MNRWTTIETRRKVHLNGSTPLQKRLNWDPLIVSNRWQGNFQPVFASIRLWRMLEDSLIQRLSMTKRRSGFCPRVSSLHLMLSKFGATLKAYLASQPPCLWLWFHLSWSELWFAMRDSRHLCCHFSDVVDCCEVLAAHCCLSSILFLSILFWPQELV